jgi:hypothetical protein
VWLVLAPPQALAQSPPPPSDVPQFLPAADFSFTWLSLLTSDKRFDWDARVTFDIDIVDYGRGRVSFHTDYSAVLGRERHRYDLNQGNYAFKTAASYRVRPVEIAAVISHASRHLVDRDFVPAISWNEIGIRAGYASTKLTGTSPRSVPVLEGEVELTHAMQQAYVDYVWLTHVRFDARHPLNARASLVASGYGEVRGVDHLVRGERVCGGWIEGGIRLNGRAAAVELFGGYERRVDAYPTDRFRVRMFTLGFRIVSLKR